MHIPKKYFHDRAVLLLLSVNSFLALAGSALLLLRLGNNSESYLIQYRSNLGFDATKAGPISQLIAFILFALFVFIFNTVLSMRIYTVRRHYSIVLLAFATVLLIFNFVVSNALLSSSSAIQVLLSIVLIVVTFFVTVVDRKR